MPSLISAKNRGKFRPQRADIPKRVVAYLPRGKTATIEVMAYGEKIDGIKLASMPATDALLKSTLGTAHHLRRFPVHVSATGQYPHETTQHRLARVAKWIAGFLPGSKPQLVDGGTRIKVVLWADEAQKLQYGLMGNYKIS